MSVIEFSCVPIRIAIQQTEAHREKMLTEEAKALLRRGQTAERGFADVKEHRKLRRMTGCGLSRARTDARSLSTPVTSTQTRCCPTLMRNSTNVDGSLEIVA